MIPVSYHGGLSLIYTKSNGSFQYKYILDLKVPLLRRSPLDRLCLCLHHIYVYPTFGLPKIAVLVLDYVSETII